MTLSKALRDLGLHFYNHEMGRIIAALYLVGRSIYEGRLMNKIP